MKLLQKIKGTSRYDEITKVVSIYLYLNSGHRAYEWIRINSNLPSLSSILKYLNEKKDIVEGEVRSKELKNFLESRSLPPCIWISEDGTRIVSKVKP